MDEGENPPKALLYFLLLIAVTTCSSAAVVFDQLLFLGVPPFLAASWRLFCQELVLLGPFLLTCHKHRMDPSEPESQPEHRQQQNYGNDGNQAFSECTPLIENEVAHKSHELHLDETRQWERQEPLMKRYLLSLPWMLLSGFFFGLHFSSWVYSIQHTSLTHSLLWVSMGPIIINSGHWILYFVVCLHQQYWKTLPSFTEGPITKPSRMETAGAVTGLFGAALILLDVQKGASPASNTDQGSGFDKSHDPSLKGDLAAFIGAIAVSLYFVIGQRLRKWVPVWMYSFPVVGCGAITCAFFNWLSDRENMSFGLDGPNALFGFAGKHFWWMSMYLGAGPGVCGHTLVTGLLKYISPLTVSTAMLLETPIGSLLGYYLGMQPIPAAWTWIGGLILLMGLFMVILSEQKENDNDAAVLSCDERREYAVDITD